MTGSRHQHQPILEKLLVHERVHPSGQPVDGDVHAAIAELVFKVTRPRGCIEY
jgi:hypothetical protein